MAELKPPYLIAKPWLLKAFEKFGKTRLNKINRETIKNFGITSLGNESKMISALKFLGIINKEGEVNQEKYKIFSYSEEKRKEELKKIVEESYKNLFNDLDINKINFNDLKDYFIHKYDFTRFQSEKASLIFIFLANLSGIDLPKELQKRNREIKKMKKCYTRKLVMETKKDKERQLKRTKNFLIILESNDGKFSYEIDNLEDWNKIKEIIKNIISLSDNQGLHVQKEDTSLYDESDKVESD